MADTFEQLVNNGRGRPCHLRTLRGKVGRPELHKPDSYSTCCKFKAIRTPFTNTTLWLIRSWLVIV